MGHYDSIRYSPKNTVFTEEEISSLEKEVKERGEIMVYDDHEGMRKVFITYKSKILSVYSGGSSSYNIYYDPDKIQRIAKNMLS